MYARVICNQCSGSGEGSNEIVKCEKCHGSGEEQINVCSRCDEPYNGSTVFKGDVCADCYDELFNCQNCGE